MASAIIVTNQLVTASGTTLTPTTEVSGYEVENVQVYQPGESYRTTTLSPGYVDIDFAAYETVNTIAALYTNVSAHPNLLHYGNDFNHGSADWSQNELTVGADDLNDIPIAGLGYSQSLTSSANSDTHHIDQGFQLPDSDTFNMFIASVYVRDTGSAAAVCLEINNGAYIGGAEYLRGFFNIDTGTVNSTTRSTNTSSDISATIATVTPVMGSDTWYRITVIGAFSTSQNAIGARIYVCDASYNLTHSDTLNCGAAAFQLEYDPTLATAALEASAYYDDINGVRAAWWEATTDSTNVPWQLCARTDLTAQPYLHLIGSLASPVATNDVRINIYDPTNADGYIEIGNVVIGKAFSPTKPVGFGWELAWAEEGQSWRALGGQMYRPVNKRARTLSFSFDWLKESEALEDVYGIDSRVGRSEGLLVSIDPDNTYTDKYTIWGMQELAPLMSHGYSNTLGTNTYRRQWSITEALP